VTTEAADESAPEASIVDAPSIVDAHCHIIVPEMSTSAVPGSWRPALRREDDRQVVDFRGTTMRSIAGEFTDVEVMLADAAKAGIGRLVLSPWITLVPAGAAEPGEARRVCQVQNEALARIAAAHPGRVSALGATALQDPDAAARDLAALMTVPGMHGVEVPASVRGTYLGDDRFAPFWAAAEETGAVVFIHPTTKGFGLAALDEYYLWNSVGNPLETAVTAAQLAVSGVLERYPGLRILLAHGGGALLSVRGRLRRAFATAAAAGARSDHDPDTSLRRFYYDTITHDQALLADLVSYAGVDHVLLGSDNPFDMRSERPAEDVRALGLGDAARLILGGNAERLLGIADG
jgi:aminocarboxymuconate-semialdehyde decarboxylase